jgi:tripartite-type tricarboxylate transporter receptor subunit TctC
MKSPLNRLSTIGLILLTILAFGNSYAQSPSASSEAFPSKPVRIIHVTPAGGILDVAARQLAEKLIGRGEVAQRVHLLETKGGRR